MRKQNPHWQRSMFLHLTSCPVLPLTQSRPYITQTFESLMDIFQCLRKTLSDRSFQAEEESLISNIETSIKNCDELIQELQDECQKFSKTPNGIKTAVRVAGRRAIYPFRQSTLQKLDENIGEIRANLSSALDVLQLKDNKRTQDDITEIKVLLDLIRTSQISSNLRDWLNAPDASIDHNTACAKKHPGTGTWLVKSPQFSRWLIEENSIMWLNGFAGSGKSVLCSTGYSLLCGTEDLTPRSGLHTFISPSIMSRNKMCRLCYGHCYYNCRASSETAMQISPGCIPVKMQSTTGNPMEKVSSQSERSPSAREFFPICRAVSRDRSNNARKSAR